MKPVYAIFLLVLISLGVLFTVFAFTRPQDENLACAPYPSCAGEGCIMCDGYCSSVNITRPGCQ